MIKRRHFIPIFLLIVGGTLWGCSPDGSEEGTELAQTPSATIILPTVTPTELPMAARVNGEGILLSEYQAGLKQFGDAQAGLGKTSTEEERSQMVIDNLIVETLLAQAAYQDGFKMDEAALDEAIQNLIEKAGGDEAVKDWQSRMGYSEDDFRKAIKRSRAAAWEKQKIIDGVPTSAEQIRARQILVFEKDIADQVYTQLQGGAEFKEKGWLFDPLTGGDLGWFPRGYLLLPEIEEAVFKLQPGEYTPVIETAYGYHIVEVIDRVPERPLSPDALQTLQHKALEKWVSEHKEQGTIELMVN